MKKVVLDFYNRLNLGDDLFIKILLERYPKTMFYISDSGNKVCNSIADKYENLIICKYSKTAILMLKIIAKISKILKLKCLYDIISNLRVEKKLKDGGDLYLLLGGSFFIQRNEDFRLNKKYYMLIDRMFKDKPKFIIGANFGPYFTTDYKQFHSEIFSSYTDVCFREKYSYDLFSELSNVRYSADVVFQLSCHIPNKINDSFGFSVIDLLKRSDLLPYKDLYYNEIASMVISLLTCNKEVYLFSFCKYEGDEDAINYILKLIPCELSEKINIVCYDGHISNFLDQYMKVENMFTTRFHAMILSLKAKQNIYPLIYSDKLLNVLNDLGYMGPLKKIENITANCGVQMLKDILSNKHILHNEECDSQSQFLVIDKFLS